MAISVLETSAPARPCARGHSGFLSERDPTASLATYGVAALERAEHAVRATQTWDSMPATTSWSRPARPFRRRGTRALKQLKLTCQRGARRRGREFRPVGLSLGGIGREHDGQGE